MPPYTRHISEKESLGEKIKIYLKPEKLGLDTGPFSFLLTFNKNKTKQKPGKGILHVIYFT